MTDTQIPARLPDAFKSNDEKSAHELREALAEAKAREAQAVDAQHDAEAAQYRAEERAQAEADRADGAEAWGRALAIKHEIGTACQDTGIDPDRLDTSTLDSITEGLHEDWKTGTDVDDLDPVRHLRDWEADQ